MFKRIKLNEDNVRDIIDMVLNEVYQVEDSIEKAILSKRIFTNIANNHVINEGLITSYEAETTKRMILSLNPRKYQILINSHTNSNLNSMPSIILTFIDGINNIPTNYLNKLETLINNCGWFISEITCENDKIKELENIKVFFNKKYINMVLEPKFDIKVNVDDYPEHLYHITQTKNISRIKKQGLTPRNDCKITYHPQRIYLLSDKTNWKNVAVFFYNTTNNKSNKYIDYNNYSLLEINVDYFKKYQYSLMYDPNGSENAYFTNDSIAPSLIKVIDNYQIS